MKLDPNNYKAGYISLSLSDCELGKLCFSLFSKNNEEICDIFIKLCKGEFKSKRYYNNKLHIQNFEIKKIIRRKYIEIEEIYIDDFLSRKLNTSITNYDDSLNISISNYSCNNYLLKYKIKGRKLMFIIVFSDFYDPDYLTFGEIIGGLEVFDYIKKAATNASGIPTFPIFISDSGLFYEKIDDNFSDLDETMITSIDDSYIQYDVGLKDIMCDNDDTIIDDIIIDKNTKKIEKLTTITKYKKFKKKIIKLTNTVTNQNIKISEIIKQKGSLCDDIEYQVKASKIRSKKIEKYLFTKKIIKKDTKNNLNRSVL